MLGSANTDENAFPKADQVDFERRPNPHFAFGGGPHRCLGSHLARAELSVAFREIHRRIPEYRIKPGEDPRYAIAIREVQYLPLVFGDSSQGAS
jgi:cytochrome P450